MLARDRRTRPVNLGHVPPANCDVQLWVVLLIVPELVEFTVAAIFIAQACGEDELAEAAEEPA